MLYGLPWKAIFVLVPILGLLMLGLVIALRSGVANLTSHQGVERLLANFSYLLLRMAGYLLGILALQQIVGAPFTVSW